MSRILKKMFFINPNNEFYAFITPLLKTTKSYFEVAECFCEGGTLYVCNLCFSSDVHTHNSICDNFVFVRVFEIFCTCQLECASRS